MPDGEQWLVPSFRVLVSKLGTGLEKLSVHRLGAREHIFLEVFNSEMMLSGY